LTGQSRVYLEEEADESAFWLELLIDAGLMSESKIRPLLNEASEIVAIMASSKKTASRSTRQSQIP
jgi:four helix bundle protein